MRRLGFLLFVVAEIWKEENKPGVLQMSELVWQLWDRRCIEQAVSNLAYIFCQHMENVHDESQLEIGLRGWETAR